MLISVPDGDEILTLPLITYSEARHALRAGVAYAIYSRRGHGRMIEPEGPEVGPLRDIGFIPPSSDDF